jgi:phage-related minor tail protein
MREAAGMQASDGSPIIGGGLDGTGVDNAVKNMDISNPISQAIAGASQSVKDWYANMQNGGGIFGAEGGILNEPVIGFGQNSGRKYTLGESGREAVIPLNKTGGQGMGGGTNISINIQNMSGSQNDLNNLRKTILTVIQESSIGRVRA